MADDVFNDGEDPFSNMIKKVRINAGEMSEEDEIDADIVDRIEEDERRVEEEYKNQNQEEVEETEEIEEEEEVKEERKETEEKEESYESHISPDYIGEREDDDNDFSGYVNPAEELLTYSGDDGITFDEMNRGGTKKEEEFDEINGFDPQNINEEKKPLMELKGGKNKSGKFKKNILLGALIFIVALVMIYVEVISTKKKKEAEKAAKVEETVNLRNYEPDFGDYQKRKYTNQEIPKEDNKTDKDKQAVQSLLEAEQKMNEAGQQRQEQNYHLTRAEETSVQQPVAASSSASSGPTPREKANDSPIRMNTQGFGNNGYEPNYSQSYANTLPASIGDARTEYLNNLNTTTQKLMGNQMQNNGISVRGNNTDGAYDRTAVGGNISYIASHSLYPGTVIQAVLINGINTDYPGNISARVTNPVYDSKTGKELLIPAGSILRGSYSSASIGVSRVQIAWQTLILNRDGEDYIVNLGSMPGVDKSGYSGIRGTLNDHTFQYLRAAGMSVLFTAINSNIYSITQAQKSKTMQDMIASGQDVGNQLADKLLDRALSIEPTVVVRPGTRIAVDVDQVLTLPEFKKDEVKGKWVRK